MDAFRDNVVLLTGASEGIGRALAVRLARSGASLALAARNRERLASAVAECEACGAQALAIPTDVTIQAECERLVARTVEHFGRLDTLIVNAGATMWTRLDELDDVTVLERLMAVNYFGAVYCTKAALPHLKQSRGRIVAVSSVAGLTGVPARTGYCATKHAMIGFYDALRIELVDDGVSVTVIAPDFVVSQIHRRAVGSDGQPLGETPMQESRIMTAEECADLIVAAAAARRRLLITSRRGRLGRWLKLIRPSLIDRIAKRAIDQRY